jgi:hypothetical protein
MQLMGSKKLKADKESGPGVWAQEVGRCKSVGPMIPCSIIMSQLGVISIPTFSLRSRVYQWGDLSKKSMQMSSGKPIRRILKHGKKDALACQLLMRP